MDPSRWWGMILVLIAMPAWAEETESERVRRLEAMTPEQKEELLSKKKRFDAPEEEAERQRLRDLHVAIESAPNAPQLQATLSRYHAWLNTLSSGQRSELLSLPPDKRIERIKELLQQQQIQRFQSFAGNLPQADRDAIYKWVVDFIRRHKEELEQLLPPDARDRLRHARDEASRTRTLAFTLQWRWREAQQPLPSASDIDELIPLLSPEAQAQIKQAQTIEEQHQRVKELARAAIMSQLVPPASEEELRKFYDKLPVEQRGRLEALEGEEFTRELRRQYNFARFRERGGPWSGWGGPSRGSRPPGDGRQGDGRPGDGRPGDGRPGGRRPGSEKGENGDDRPSYDRRPKGPAPDEPVIEKPEPTDS